MLKSRSGVRPGSYAKSQEAISRDVKPSIDLKLVSRSRALGPTLPLSIHLQAAGQFYIYIFIAASLSAGNATGN
jgi:hypothetical protein